MNKNRSILRSALSPSITLATLAACSFVSSSHAGIAPPPGDWYQDGFDNWHLDDPLVGESASADSTGFAELEVEDGLNATIDSDGSWETDIDGFAGIAFDTEGTLTLDGDLTFINGDDDDDDDDDDLIRVGVLFEEGGELAGDSDLTVESSSDDPAIILAGVVSDGDLDISDFEGSVAVTNDNSGGLPDADDDVDFGGLLGDLEIDIESSAVAIGIAAIDVDALGDFIGSFDLGALAEAFLGPQITGPLTQEVTVASVSNDVISTTATEDGSVDAVVFAASVGVAGNLADGIDGADVSSTATGGSVTALSTIVPFGDDDDDDDDDAFAATLAVAVGVAGGADSITGETSIAAVATADDAIASIDGDDDDDDDDAAAISIAAAVGVAGVVGDIDGGDDATVTISANATTESTTANAIDDAMSINAAIALGLGAGVDENVNGADVSATATTGKADATSDYYNSNALNIAAAAAVGGVIGGDISGSTLTASAETGDTTADDTDYNASATTIAVSAGVIGVVEGTVSDTTINATSVTGNAKAVSDSSDVHANSLSFAAGILGSVHAVSEEDGDVIINVSATSGNAAADTFADDDDAYAIASAYAYGIADFEAIGGLLEGLPDILGGIVPDPIESDDPYTTTELAGTITVEALAGDATAHADDDDDDDDSFASADAGATGFAGDITGDVSATIVTTATAGIAEATTDLEYVDAEAIANAYAAGIDGGIYASEFADDDDDDDDDDVPTYSGSVTATANAGTATADSLEDSADAEAYAESLGVAYLAGTMDGDITSNANGGIATADSSDSDARAATEWNEEDNWEDGEKGGADAFASGMNRLEGDMTSTASINATAIGGEATATTYHDEGDDGESAYASAHADAYGIADGVGTLESILKPIDPSLSQISGEITATATAGISTADAYLYGEADAAAHAYGVHAHDSIVADFTSDFVSTSTATGGVATAYGDSGADAYAEAEAGALMHSNRFEGDFGGTVTATATGGAADANTYEDFNYAYAEADAGAYGIAMGDDDDDDDDDSVTGDFTAVVTLTATAGDADAYADDYGADASATARTAGIDSAGSFEGEFGGSVNAKSYGGTANSDADEFGYATAGAKAYGLDFSGRDADLDGNVTSNITLLAEAGALAEVVRDDVIEAIDADDDDDDDDQGAWADGYYEAEAYANARVAAVSDVDDFTGDFSSTVNATSTAGYADAEAWSGDAYAEANAEAYGVEFYGDDDDDDDDDMYENVFSGDFTEDANVTLIATGGLATASSGDDDDDDDDHAGAEANAFAGVMVNLERYEGDFDGTAVVLTTGGDATAYGRDTASAEAYAEAVGIAIDDYEGIEFDADDDDDDDDSFVGDFTGSLTADAIGGDAYAEVNSFIPNDAIEASDDDDDDDDSYADVLADASAETIGISADVVGSVSGVLDLNAAAGTAEAEGFYEDTVLSLAYASVTGIDGNVYADDDDDDDDAITGSFTLDATGGTAVSSVVEPVLQSDEVIEGLPYGSTVIADASADATAVDGMVYGYVVDASFDVEATGGTSVATNVGFELMSSTLSIATADAAGIDGETSSFDGDMDVTAVGGVAFLENESDMFTDEIEAVDLMVGGAFADASATATGLGDGESGPFEAYFVAGTIDVTATGGTVAVLNDYPVKLPPPDAIESDVAITETAYNANAQAIGIDGNSLIAEMDAVITATATGGTVIIEEFGMYPDEIESDSIYIDYNADASAFAAGIAGNQVEIYDVSGGIIATATPGVVGPSFGSIRVDVIDGGELDEGPEIPELPVLDDTFAMVGNAFAAGIMTYDNYVEEVPDGGDVIEGEPSMSSLDVLISTYVHTFVEAPEGYELSEENSYAAAVYSGQGDDYVELAEGADIIGDINTGDGLNEVTVTGDTIMEGNILSTSLEWINEWLDIDNGVGTVDFDIESGLFTAVRSVGISDLTDTLEIGAEGGLAPVLSQDPEDGDTSVLVVGYGNYGNTADVNIASGATIRPVIADGVDMNNVVGNEYTIIDAEGLITDNGAIVDNSLTPFEYSVKVISDIPEDAIEGIESTPSAGNDYVLTVDGVQDQDGEQTPGSVQAAQAVSSASQAVMLDVSKHASLLRSLLRRSPASNASAGSSPTGAAGPNADGVRNGDWLSYVSAFGNIGSQDSGSGYAGFDYDTYGVVMGMERLMGPQLILGVAGSYASTDIDGKKNSGGGDSDIYSGAVYANWFTDTWYVDGGLTYGQADNDVDRVDYKGAKYRGSYDSDLIGTWAEVGFTTEHGDFGVEPYGRFTYVYGDHDGFTDEGPDDEVMTTDDNETDNFKTELGARLNREWIYEDNSSFLVEVKAAWEHEWADRGVSVNSSYLGDSNLDIDSADADRDALILGVRAEWSCGEGLSFGVEYEPTISGNWYNHAFSGTVQYNW